MTDTPMTNAPRSVTEPIMTDTKGTPNLHDHEKCKACYQTSAALATAQAELETLRVAFAHYHVNYGDGSDTCKECGLDLRNPVHFSEYRDKQIAKYAARGKS